MFILIYDYVGGMLTKGFFLEELCKVFFYLNRNREIIYFLFS